METPAKLMVVAILYIVFYFFSLKGKSKKYNTRDYKSPTTKSKRFAPYMNNTKCKDGEHDLKDVDHLVLTTPKVPKSGVVGVVGYAPRLECTKCDHKGAFASNKIHDEEDIEEVTMTAAEYKDFISDSSIFVVDFGSNMCEIPKKFKLGSEVEKK